MRIRLLAANPFIYYQRMGTIAQNTGEIADKLGHTPHPSMTQLSWLRRGLRQPGGKLPLFDEWGQRVNEQTVRSCIAQGWAEPWFANPLKPDWLVCKLTAAGRDVATEA